MQIYIKLLVNSLDISPSFTAIFLNFLFMQFLTGLNFLQSWNDVFFQRLVLEGLLSLLAVDIFSEQKTFPRNGAVFSLLDVLISQFFVEKFLKPLV